jgi:hypothetical protein
MNLLVIIVVNVAITVDAATASSATSHPAAAVSSPEPDLLWNLCQSFKTLPLHLVVPDTYRY